MRRERSGEVPGSHEEEGREHAKDRPGTDPFEMLGLFPGQAAK